MNLNKKVMLGWKRKNRLNMLNTVADFKLKVNEVFKLQSAHDALLPMTPEWFKSLRLKFFQDFLLFDFDQQPEKYWHVKEILQLLNQHLQLIRQSSSFSNAVLDFLSPRRLTDPDKVSLVFVDGFWSPQLSNTKCLPPGVILMGLRQALENFPELLENYLSKTTLANNFQPFAALNLGLALDGVFLYCKENIVIDNPIHLIFLGTDAGQHKLFNLNNLLVAKEKSKVTILTEHLSFNSGQYFANSFTQIFAESSAEVSCYNLQNTDSDVVCLNNTMIEQHALSKVKLNQVDCGGCLTHDNLKASLVGEKAELLIKGLSLIKGKSKHLHSAVIEHIAAHSASRELYKSIVDDEAVNVFQGKIVVKPNAIKTDALLKNHNLILKDSAQVVTLPQLEIYADDVKCNHGATVGQLDDKALFYLRSRGIPRHDAEKMLILAFAEEVLNSLEQPLLRDLIKKRVDEQLLIVN
jgi:Fe-S cluster assembly protein SufD